MERDGASLSWKKDDEEVILPGFRFYPTDEELVGFYLRRKVEKKPLKIELIKQVDIYKYDPWDLPRVSSNVMGEKEGYFFCIRGRKYKNSIRPNRVTGSGFWKATGIDRPIYSAKIPHHPCIGLKKSLVYYRGSAGKGTKTDWMMHEFRLPPTGGNKDAEKAEVWTLCRIFKRIPTYRKYTAPEWKETTFKEIPTKSSLKLSSYGSNDDSEQSLSFGSAHSVVFQQNERKPVVQHVDQTHYFMLNHYNPIPEAPISASYWNLSGEEFFMNGVNWDELRSIVQGD